MPRLLLPLCLFALTSSLLLAQQVDERHGIRPTRRPLQATLGNFGTAVANMNLAGRDYTVVGDPDANRIYFFETEVLAIRDSGGFNPDPIPSLVLLPPVGISPSITAPDGFGFSLANVGSVNPTVDATDDLAVGAPRTDVIATTVMPDAGAIYYFDGAKIAVQLPSTPPAVFPAPTPSAPLIVTPVGGPPAPPHLIVVGASPQARYGHAVVKLTGVAPKIVASAPGHNGEGLVTIYDEGGWNQVTEIPFSETGLTSTDPEFGASLLAVELVELSSGALPASGFVIGAPGADSSGMQDNGHVQLWHIQGPNSSPRASGSVGGADDGTRLGAALAGGDDLNGDGIGDLVAIGAPGSPSPGGGSFPGAVIVRRLVALSQPYAAAYGSADMDAFGTSILSLPDQNLDRMDLMVGAPQTGVGCGYVERISIDFVTPSPVVSLTPQVFRGFRAEGEFMGDEFGTSLSVVGDINGSGSRDLMVGAPGFDADQGGVQAVLIDEVWRGTDEDLQLAVGIEAWPPATVAPPLTGPAAQEIQAPASSAGWLVRLDLKSPEGTFNGAPLLLLAELQSNSVSVDPYPLLPGFLVNLDPLIGLAGNPDRTLVLLTPFPAPLLTPAISPSAAALSFYLPTQPSEAIVFQGATISPLSENLTYTTSHAVLVSF